jgi:hypothetical protein
MDVILGHVRKNGEAVLRIATRYVERHFEPAGPA